MRRRSTSDGGPRGAGADLHGHEPRQLAGPPSRPGRAQYWLQLLPPVQPLVGQQPRAIVLDHAADRAEPRAVRLAHLADAGLDAVLQAEPAVVGAVVGRVGVQPADGGADHLGQAQQMREEPRVVDVGGRGDRAPAGCRRSRPRRGTWSRPCRGRWDWGRSARRRAWPGPNNCRPPRPKGGLGSRAHHPDQGDMDLAQHGRGAPAVQAAAQGGAASTPGGGPQLAPLHTLANEEPERLDHLDGRQGRSPGAVRPVLDPVETSA